MNKDEKYQEIDTSWTDLVTCPYCGYEDRDSWEHDFGDGQIEIEIECEECQMTFTVMRHEVDYYSSKQMKTVLGKTH